MHHWQRVPKWQANDPSWLLWWKLTSSISLLNSSQLKWMCIRCFIIIFYMQFRLRFFISSVAWQLFWLFSVLFFTWYCWCCLETSPMFDSCCKDFLAGSLWRSSCVIRCLQQWYWRSDQGIAFSLAYVILRESRLVLARWLSWQVCKSAPMSVRDIFLL